MLWSEHPFTLNHVSNLGLLLNSQGRYDEAEAMHRRALKGTEKMLDPEHPDRLASVVHLGSCLDSQGKYEEAKAIRQRIPVDHRLK